MNSVFGACLRLGTMSDQTARQALRDRLPKRRQMLEAKLNAALREPLPSKTRRRRRALAIDLHEIPYHGNSPHNHVLHKRPRAGTTKFFAYATACLVEKGHRYTLAFTWVKANETIDLLLDAHAQTIGPFAVAGRVAGAIDAVMACGAAILEGAAVRFVTDVGHRVLDGRIADLVVAEDGAGLIVNDVEGDASADDLLGLFEFEGAVLNERGAAFVVRNSCTAPSSAALS